MSDFKAEMLYFGGLLLMGGQAEVEGEEGMKGEGREMEGEGKRREEVRGEEGREGEWLAPKYFGLERSLIGAVVGLTSILDRRQFS